MASKLAKVSIVIATLNSGRTIVPCLSSISTQKYSGEVEIVIADGGSTDSTIEIAESFRAKIVTNPLKTGEAGKAVGIRKATGEIIALIDSDNILPDDLWLEKMVRPFSNSEVVATEPLYFTYRKSDKLLTRYFALLGMGDPLTLFLGNYDRLSHLTGKWTEMKIKTKEKKDLIELYLRDKMPTIGANGFLIRKKEIERYIPSKYLFDIDLLKEIAADRQILVVKVKIGIIHIFSGDIATFIRKQKRRIRDFLHYRKSGMRKDQVDKITSIWGVTKFIASCLTVVPLVFQSIKGYLKKPDPAWFFHPLACYITLFVYSTELVRSFFTTSELNRTNWKQ